MDDPLLDIFVTFVKVESLLNSVFDLYSRDSTDECRKVKKHVRVTHM